MTTEQPTTPNPLSVLWDEFAEAAILDAEYGEDIELEPLREAIYDFIRAETAAPLEEALRLAASMLVAGAHVVDKHYPDDPVTQVQDDMRAFARWVLDGAQGPPPVSAEARAHQDEFLSALTAYERALSSPGGGEAVVSAAPSIPGDAP
jgi:hypothetical protein